MFTDAAGLPPILVEYFVALNRRDVARVMACIHPNITVRVENGPHYVSAIDGSDEYEGMLRATSNLKLLAVSPVSADLDGATISVQASIFAIRPSGTSLRFMQRIDIQLSDGLIISMQMELPRHRREFTPAPGAPHFYP